MKEGAARYAMIPVENSIAGRVADVHHLIPESGLYMVGERFVPIRHQLLGLPDATARGTESRALASPSAWTMPQAVARTWRRSRETADTAGAAREIAELGDR